MTILKAAKEDEIRQIIKQKNSFKNLKSADKEECGIICNNFDEGKIIEDTKEYISDSAAEKINKVSKGSLLMSFKLSIGRMAFAGDDLYTNEAIIAIPESNKFILRFIYYYLLQYNWLSLTLITGQEGRNHICALTKSESMQYMRGHRN